jgi:hypothetical protein
MGEKAELILQGHVHGEVRVESSDSQEKTERIVKRTYFEF